MTPREQGYLLLTAYLGDYDREVLTMSQYQQLLQDIRQLPLPQRSGGITEEVILSLGYSTAFARQVTGLLSQRKLLHTYLTSAKKHDCYPLLPITESYPEAVRQKLGVQMPCSIWAKGNVELLRTPIVSLVGSRDLWEENERFAYYVGMQAAFQGYTLLSGNARGADRTAQNSCLAHGGKVISIVADRLMDCPNDDNILYLSEDGFEFSFSGRRALSRNRLIHCMGQCVFVAQLQAYRGGTWSGTSANLKNRWSPVFYFDDGSKDTAVIARLGAKGIDGHALGDIAALL